MLKFFDLPREIRDQVYATVLSIADSPPPSADQLADHEFTNCSKERYRIKLRRQPYEAFATSLLITNRRVKQEVQECAARVKLNCCLNVLIITEPIPRNELNKEAWLCPTTAFIACRSERLERLEVNLWALGGYGPISSGRAFLPSRNRHAAQLLVKTFFHLIGKFQMFCRDFSKDLQPETHPGPMKVHVLVIKLADGKDSPWSFADTKYLEHLFSNFINGSNFSNHGVSRPVREALSQDIGCIKLYRDEKLVRSGNFRSLKRLTEQTTKL
ncbi:MAG: hypothetical protein M1820_009248 [Bogoriella megaspora]|nr:MAG: hypothetical protein M1820_009248 [Bogoriella megaspora]